jgi:uncharacterized protein with GYD domain
MPTYVNLLNWTDQGIKNFRDTVARADVVEEQMGQLGVTLREILWTQGLYDIVAISEAPDDETGTAFLLGLGAQGNVRSTTMRAFDREEMKKVIAKLG